ncbi:uncharacterized protein LOC116921306 isoform X1 [Daphnia magna]|uniref:uncharacterized protein LOC116921306 isoform X1 n=1 Tax=Daphnia magna TaxID=35525 RepID=UPI001E1BA9A2|nr:uncharacterized protein LOC116921306 isoform X1 [Daphnia magna]
MCAKPTIGNEKTVEGRPFDEEHLYFLNLVILFQSAVAAPTNFLQPFESFFNQQKVQSGSETEMKARSIDTNGGFTKEPNFFEDFKILDDFGKNFPQYTELTKNETESGQTSQTARVPQKNEYYSYSFSTPVEDVSGDDVIAVVNVKHSPKVYFYQVAEAGPRHLKVMYFTGFPNRQRVRSNTN